MCVPLKQGIRFFPSWKALPNYALSKELGKPRSPYLDFPLELKVNGSLLRFIHSKGESPLALWPHRIRYAMDKWNEQFYHIDLDWCESTFAPLLPSVVVRNSSCLYIGLAY